MGFSTPLRYPGGKGRLGLWLSGLIKHNQLDGGWYVEPYAGGAGAAFFLLFNGFVSHIVINDADPVIHAFWECVVNDTRRLVRLIEKVPVTIDEWHRQREVLLNHQNFDQVEVALATFFLNRANRSGILSGGVIGGKGQAGELKLDARFNKSDLLCRIEQIGSRRKSINVYNLDALDVLEMVDAEAPTRSLTYLDPPYFEKGGQLYRNYYKPEDHAAISDKVRELTKPWLVTYDNCETINTLYAGLPRAEFSLFYSVHDVRTKATEVMFYGNATLKEDPYMTRRHQ